MPEINETRLREQISKNQLASLYFLYGEEKFLVKRDVLRLTRKFSTADFPVPSIRRPPLNTVLCNAFLLIVTLLCRLSAGGGALGSAACEIQVIAEPGKGLLSLVVTGRCSLYRLP